MNQRGMQRENANGTKGVREIVGGWEIRNETYQNNKCSLGYEMIFLFVLTPTVFILGFFLHIFEIYMKRKARKHYDGWKITAFLKASVKERKLYFIKMFEIWKILVLKSLYGNNGVERIEPHFLKAHSILLSQRLM